MTPELIPLELIQFAAKSGEKDGLAMFGRYAVSKLPADEIGAWTVGLAEKTTFAQIIKPVLVELLEKKKFDAWLSVVNQAKLSSKKTYTSILNAPVRNGCGWTEAWFAELGENITVKQANVLRPFAEHAKAKAMSAKACQKSTINYLLWLAKLSKSLRQQPGGEKEWGYWWKEWGVPLVLTEQNLKPRYGVAFEPLFRVDAQSQAALLRNLADTLNCSQTYVDAVELKGAPVFWEGLGDFLLPEALDAWWEGFKHASTPSHSEKGLKARVSEKWMSPERVWMSGHAHRLTAESGRSWMERKLLQEKHLASHSQNTGPASAL